MSRAGHSRWRIAGAWTISILLAAVAARSQVSDAALLGQVRRPAFTGEGFVAPPGLVIPLGPASFEIERGFLFPAYVGAQVVELVFIGHARLRLDPPDEIEAGQLELFTGNESLDAPIEEAVLVLPDRARSLIEASAPRESRPELVARAVGLHREWVAGAERRAAGVDAALFAAILGDPALSGYSAAWLRSHEFGDFVLELDVEGTEPVTLASFRPISLSRWDRKRIEHEIRAQQRKDRWLDVRVDDLGVWDVWVSAPWSVRTVEPRESPAAFESRHYELDVKVFRDRMRLAGHAKIFVTTRSDGRCLLPLDLFRDLAVDRVTDERGRELFHFRSGERVLVRLPEPSRGGEERVFDVSWSGRVLQWVGRSTFDLLDTSSWYPHVGAVDRATYDVRIEWPRGYDLVAGGELVTSGRHGGRRWERRRIAVPAIAFSFALGEFTFDHRRAGQIDVTVAISRSAPGRLTPAIRERLMQKTVEALKFFEEKFGPHPLREITLVTLPRRYSQSYLGFITLSDSVLEPSGSSGSDVGVATVAHELAHQWWGNRVGWRSYRDQWLSEAMAQYAALLWRAKTMGAEDEILSAMSAGWRQTLGRPTISGRTLESLGPVVLGARLNSSRGQDAYNSIVYRKGAVVLAMLARAIGEARFLGALREITASTEVLSTDGFLDAVERAGEIDLDGFARQYIYGTGIPQVYYDWRPEAGAGGEWFARGEARVRQSLNWRVALVRDPAGHWDLRRELRPTRPTDRATLMVPFEVQIGATETSTAVGRLLLARPEAAFEIATSGPPRALVFDPRGETLAWFWSATRHPQRYLACRASDHLAQGRMSDAEADYLEALGAGGPPTGSAKSPRSPGDPAAIETFEEARIRLDLARLLIDAGRDADANVQLIAAEARLGRADETTYRVERDVLRARIELRVGETEAALDRLRRLLRLAFPRGRSTPRAESWQLWIGGDRHALGEAFALLAAAAHDRGHVEDRDWALREARERGVMMNELDRELP